MSWWEQAACKGKPPDWWYPPQGGDVTVFVSRARAVCASCPVRVECLHDALDHSDHHGIWGGLTPGERRPLQARYVRRPRCIGCGRRFARPTGSQVGFCSDECRVLREERRQALAEYGELPLGAIPADLKWVRPNPFGGAA